MHYLHDNRHVYCQQPLRASRLLPRMFRLLDRSSDGLQQLVSYMPYIRCHNSSRLSLKGLSRLSAVSANAQCRGKCAAAQCFGQLVWLRELHLRGNRIAALPDGFRDLLSLEVLETEGNYPKLTVLQVPPRLSRVKF